MSTTITTTTTKPAWYETSVTAIDPAAQSMLENYSGLTPEEIIPHVLALVGTHTPEDYLQPRMTSP